MAGEDRGADAGRERPGSVRQPARASLEELFRSLASSRGDPVIPLDASILGVPHGSQMSGMSDRRPFRRAEGWQAKTVPSGLRLA